MHFLSNAASRNRTKIPPPRQIPIIVPVLSEMLLPVAAGVVVAIGEVLVGEVPTNEEL